jgi:rfaE bifunctional protein nucleotidyltransferase chain/domain
VLLRLDRGGTAPAPPGPASEGTLDIFATAAAILVSDYGRGVAGHPQIRSAVEAATGPVVWDPHPRGPAPTRGVRLATPNEAEARMFAGAATGTGGGSLATVAGHGHTLRQRWGASAVAVTLGSRGAVLCTAGPTPLVVPAAPAAGDTCGAGDRFASSAAVALARGAVVSEAVQYAVGRASAYVAGGGATAVLAAPPPVFPTRAVDDAARLVADVRARGGTVVATGGCFDLLHAGHVATLQAARRLGDCLVVCLNSDRSVRRLKGPERPLTAATDRARLLAALDCVDAVAVFDEPTPERVLATLRPDIWVKGGDYADGGPDLPEAALVSSWGGQTVVVPYLDGRSTTSMIAAVRQSEGAA